MNTFFLVASPAFFIVGLFVLKLGERQRLRSSLVAYRLRFPRQLDVEAVTAFLGGLTGLLLPWWRRWLTTPFVVSEVVASRSGIEHRLLVPAAWSSTIENLMQAHLPATTYEQVDSERTTNGWGAEYRLSSSGRMLRVDAPEVSARLLSSLQPLRADEDVVVQWIVSPAAPVAPVSGATTGSSGPWWWPSSRQPTTEEATALREKRAHPLLLGQARIAVRARSRGRARALLRQVETSWHGARAPGVQLRRRIVDERRVARRSASRDVPLVNWPGTFNTDELPGLLGWPIKTEQVPGVVLGGCRPLAPSPLIGSVGTVIGAATFPGSERPVALDLEARLRHTWCVSPTGTGKSTLLLNLALQDAQAGHSLVLIDFKGDLVADFLDRAPEARRDDIVVLDPSASRPLGLNPLQSADATHAEVVVENLVGVFRSLYGAALGPRSDDLLRGALRTLARSGDFTLCEVPALFLDGGFRRRLVSKIDDPSLVEFWAWYEGLSDVERVSITAAPLNKLRAFVMRPQIRSMVGTVKPTITVREVMDEGKVMLVSLAAGVLGTEAASLLGALVLSEIWHAALARAAVPAARRRPVMCLVDEFQTIMHLPVPAAEILAAARGLALSMTLAHQHTGQLSREVLAAVRANARSKIVFQLPDQDARLLSKELGSGLTPDDLMGLDAYAVVARLFAAGRTQPALTARTFPAPPVSTDGEAVRELSRQRYGSDPAEVEAGIQERQQSTVPDAPVGRRRHGGGTP